MRLTLTFFILLLFFINADAQKITGIWRGYFSSSSGLYSQGIREENYKYEIQIDQQSNNGLRGVTYSYKTTVFYGKAEVSGIYNAVTRSLIIKENKLVDLKIGDKSEPCLMTCYLDYSKIGKLEVLEGTFISINIKDKGDCGSGKVYLERVTTSDFKKEDFLLKKKIGDTIKNKQQANVVAKSLTPPDQKTNGRIIFPPATKPGNKDNLTSKTNPPKSATTQQQKPLTALPNTTPPVVRKPVEKPVAKNKPAPTAPKEDKPFVIAKPVERVPEEGVNSKKKNAEETQQTENTSKKIEIPKVLVERENNLVQSITTSEENIEIDLWDNGTIDNDTISVYHNNKLVVSNARLSNTPIVIRIKCSKTDNRHELIVVAENLGDIPPNTAMMVINPKSGNRERHEIFLSSTEQRNAKVIINYVPK